MAHTVRGRIDRRNPVVREHTLNRGRLSWWLGLPHIAGGARFYDIAGGNHATIYNAPPRTRDPNNLDVALHLDGHIATPRYAIADCPTLSEYTMTCRVKFDALYPPDSPNSNNSLLKNWGSSTGSGYFHWNMVPQGDAAPAGNIRCYVHTSDGFFTAVTANPLSVGVAYRLVVTCGNGVLKLYTNGAPDGSASYTGSLTSNCSKIAFGCKLQDDQETPVALSIDNSLLAGTLGDCSLWDRVLSDAEVAQLDGEMRAGYPNLIRRRATFAFGTTAAPLAAGSAQIMASGPDSGAPFIEIKASAPTDGSGAGPTYQWERSDDGGSYADVTGATALTLTDTTVVAGVHYSYRCKQTRGSDTVTTNAVPAQVYPGGALTGGARRTPIIKRGR